MEDYNRRNKENEDKRIIPRFGEDDDNNWQPPEGYEDALAVAMSDDDAYPDDSPIPDFEFYLTSTKKGERKERSNIISVGDKIVFKNNEDSERVDAITSLGDIGDISNDSWLSKLADSNLEYDCEIIELISYDQLENKRCNPVITVKLHINATCGEFREALELFYIPSGIYDSGQWF